MFIAAERIARRRGNRTLEAEHLLLALAELGEPELAEVDVDKKVLRGHMLLGVLSAEEGTVPHALSLAGVDRRALASRVATRL